MGTGAFKAWVLSRKLEMNLGVILMSLMSLGVISLCVCEKRGVFDEFGGAFDEFGRGFWNKSLEMR